MQTIKKYANRKLYHTNRKQYITLEGIATLIQAGDQVQVLDNETGEDITAQILTQVVLQTRGGGDRRRFDGVRHSRSRAGTTDSG